MRTRLRSFPIQRKLRLVVLATCTAALCVACSALFALQFYFFQRDFKRDLAAVGELLASNSTAVLKFADPDHARENLAALKAKPNITGSALVLKDGTVLASVGRVHVPKAGEANPPVGFHTEGDDLVFVEPILLQGERLGALILHADYRRQANRLHGLYASILVAVLSISFLVAVFVSWKLERVILDPIQNLAETARHIMANNDYSARASKVVDDEVGTFHRFLQQHARAKSRPATPPCATRSPSANGRKRNCSARNSNSSMPRARPAWRKWPRACSTTSATSSTA